jgi:hypothetical protein
MGIWDSECTIEPEFAPSAARQQWRGARAEGTRQDRTGGLGRSNMRGDRDPRDVAAGALQGEATAPIAAQPGAPRYAGTYDPVPYFMDPCAESPPRRATPAAI